jgi:hypothetical protein
MSPKLKKEYMREIKTRYQNSSKKEKQLILDEFCKVCDYNRKYAIRIINSSPSVPHKHQLSKRGRKKHYSDPLIKEILWNMWTITNLPCSKRLKAILPLWLPHYEYEIPDRIFSLLLSISHATIDRLMKPDRAKFAKKGLSTTKPGSLLRKHIPIKTEQWNETVPGFIEVDTVAHCGSSTAGMFVYTINSVDIATQWSEQRAVWGRGENGVINAIENIENSLPFELKGFDCDNGSEFLNWHLYHYFVQRKKPVNFTRSRAYRKNDNAHIEEKNWTHVRQYLGYERFDKIELVQHLNNLYTTEWRLLFNFFMPSVKLQDKIRVGSKVIKKHDQPKTPFQRVLESTEIPEDTKTQLKKDFENLNPFVLQRNMTAKIKAILKIVKAHEIPNKKL